MMGDPRQVRVAFDNANAFLSPVLSRGIVTQFVLYAELEADSNLR